MSTVDKTTPIWGEDVIAGEYAGHPGLLYSPRPSSLVDVLDDSARFGAREFLVQGDRRIGFDVFRRAAFDAARVLGDHGIGRGERVLVWAYNSPAWVLSIWALWVVGAVPVLGNRWWSDEELAGAIARTSPVAVISDGAPEVTVPVIATTLLDESFDRAVDGSLLSGHELDDDVVDHDIDEDDEALILFTSGSSGDAKGVRLSHRAIIATQHNLLLRSHRLPHMLDLERPQTVSLITLPLFHIGGVTTVVTQVIVGGRLVFLRGRFDAGEVLALIESEQVTVWAAVPTMAKRVLEHPDFDCTDLSSLRSFPLGGAPVPPVLLEELRAKIPHLERGLATTWGLSESGGFLTLAVATDLVDRPGTVGTPYPVVEIRVADPDETGTGELLARSPSVMLGYVGIDDGTVDADGWLHTGDVGRFEDGHVFITGRSKDIVIRGGENIACPHVEAQLLRHPKVLEAAVFGIEHPDLGEELVASVVVDDPAVTPQALRAHAEGTLAYFEVPGRWDIRTDPLPILPTGKVDKQALRRDYTRRVRDESR